MGNNPPITDIEYRNSMAEGRSLESILQDIRLRHQLGLEVMPKAKRPCEVCARPLTYVATMRGVGLRPMATVYRCEHCKRIETEEKLDAN
jgi:hypothetical protein